jgi:hypothetical protein
MAEAKLTWVFNYPNHPCPQIEHRRQGLTFEEATKDWPPGAVLVRKEWDKVAWPGMYPLFYVTKDNGCLCPKCANDNLELTLNGDPQWKIEQVDINYEEVSLYCDNCHELIPTACGDN